ncbi:ecdysone-inducible protein E75-like isoform X2 [Mytilus trossulus]|uniref:ecdysone-inducible protein E75-like isoform X2 n=1 Tax=Mytilus trossulus TaxID=6551 RepID=UPI0030048C29
MTENEGLVVQKLLEGSHINAHGGREIVNADVGSEIANAHVGGEIANAAKTDVKGSCTNEDKTSDLNKDLKVKDSMHAQQQVLDTGIKSLTFNSEVIDDCSIATRDNANINDWKGFQDGDRSEKNIENTDSCESETTSLCGSTSGKSIGSSNLSEKDDIVIISADDTLNRTGSLTGKDIESKTFPPRPSKNAKRVKKIYPDGHILCKICGDKASGFHYGVFSCEGCKGFFRRTVRQKLTYKPCANGDKKGCLIMRISRNRCQYYRMKKCFDAGMSHEAVRLGRCPKKDKPSRFNLFKISSNENHDRIDIDKQIKTEELILKIHDSFMAANKEFHALTCRYQQSKVLEVKCENDTKILCSRYLPAIVHFRTLFARDLTPFKKIDVHSQRNLVKERLLEIAVIHSIYWNDETTFGKILDRFGYIVDILNCEQYGIFGQFLLDMFYSVQKLKKLELTDVELSVMAAMVLFSPDRPGLDIYKNTFLLEQMEDILCLALKSQFAQNHDNCEQLFTKIVEVLINLRTIYGVYLEIILNSQIDIVDVS